MAVFTAVALLPAAATAQATFEVRVSNNNDDAEQASGNGAMYLDSTDLELVIDGNYDTVGLRFTSVTVPKGATITNAYVQFKTDETSSGSASLTIRGQAIDNAPTFSSSNYNITSRTTTAASVAWSPPAWNSVGEAGVNQRTANIAPIIQDIVNRSGWSSGNALVIIITGTGTRIAESREGDSSGAPLLHVEYNINPNVYYVRTDGNDNNAGTGPTTAQAWQTVREATRQNVLVAGDIIYVKAGTYTDKIEPDEDGSAGLPIRVIADSSGSVTGWSAGDVILYANDRTINLDGDDYWSFEGFKIRGVSGKEAVKIKSSTGIKLLRCEIYDAGNEAIRLESTTDPLIINCLIRNSGGAGIYVKDSGCNATIWNCTIVNNAGDGIEQDNGTSNTRNSIIANNGDDGFDRNNGTMNHTYNLVYSNGTNFEGTSQSTGELTTNPQFTNPASHDYTLTSTSPAINAGTGAAGIVDEDFYQMARPIGSAWDMGFVEYPLLGYWKFDEGSGTTAADSSGNGNDGSLEGDADWEAARCGQTVTLNGTTDWVDLGQVNLGTKSYTVAAWFKTSASQEQTIFAATATGTSNHLMYLELDADGHVQFVHRSPAASSGGTTLASSDAFNDGRWHYVIAVKSTSELRLYVDGQLVGQASNTTSVHSSVDIVLGRYGISLAQRYFNGSLDEVLLYGSALSTSEAGALLGLVGRWRLDETSGSLAADSTLYGHNGSLSSGFSFSTSSISPAKVGDGLYFNGSSNYISVSNTAVLQITSSMTISAWIKGNSWGSGSDANAIVRKGEDNPNNYQLAVADGRLAFYLDDSDANGFRGTTSLATGTWYHVAATWDGSQARVYVNGVMDHASPFSKSGSIGTDNRPLYLGGRSGTDHFHGTLDEIRLYNRALCEDEIEELHRAGSARGVRVLQWVEIQ